jgi:hypothetical protein
VSVTPSGSATTSAVYDALGRRIESGVPGNYMQYIFDPHGR